MNLDKVVEQLKRDEGFSPQSFWDNDQWTYGYGTKASGPGKFISKEDAASALTERTKAAIDDFHVVFAGCVMTEGREHALVNMLFNLGMTKIRKFKNMCAGVRENDWEKAADSAMASLWYKQVGKRAERIVRELREG